MRRGRWALLAAIVLAAVGVALVASFPDRAACRESGRVVDPTGRHCVAADGYVQLREHVLFHTAQGVVLAGGAAALGLAAWAVRRRARPRATGAG